MSDAGKVKIWKLLTGADVIATEGDTPDEWRFAFLLVITGPKKMSLQPLVMASKVQTIKFNRDLILFEYEPDEEFMVQYKRTTEVMKGEMSGIIMPTAAEKSKFL